MNNYPLQDCPVGNPAADPGHDAEAQGLRSVASSSPKPDKGRAVATRVVARQVRRGPPGRVQARKADHAWGRWCW